MILGTEISGRTVWGADKVKGKAMNQFPGELSRRLMKVEVIKLRAGMDSVSTSNTEIC